MILIVLIPIFLFSFQVQAQPSIPRQLDSMEKQLTLVTEPRNKIDLLNKIAFGYLVLDTEKTLKYANEALDLANKSNADGQIGDAYNNLACYYFYKSDLAQTAKYYEQSIYYYEKAKDKKGLANVTGNLGMVQYYAGNYDKALQYSFESLNAFESLNDTIGMANEFTTIASIYMEQGLLDKAVHYDSMALSMYREIDNQDGIALILCNLGNIYQVQGLHQEAKRVYKQSLDIYRQLRNILGQATALKNFALHYNDERNYKAAYEHILEAIKLGKENNTSLLSANLIADLGVVYYLSWKNYGRTDSVYHLIPGSRSGLLRNAIRYLKQGVGIAQQNDELSTISHYANLLTDAFEMAGDPLNALKYHKISTTARDSLNNLESKKLIEKLTTEREVLLKDKQIELDRLAVEKKRNERLYFGIGIVLLLISMLFVYRNYANQKRSNVTLTALNNEIADKNTRLSATLQELSETQEQLIESEKQKEKALVRSRISQDIHDDISSGLTKIAWLSEAYMARNANAGVDIKPLERITIQARDTVSKLGEIIWSSNPDRDNLSGMLQFMQQYISNYMDDAPIRYRIDFPGPENELTVSPDIRRNLYLAMKEALHNARKYSQASEIVVSFKLDANRYRLEVSDDGVGMTPDLVQGGGHGMGNMRRRLEAIGGQMQLESSPNKGSKLVFTGEI